MSRTKVRNALLVVVPVLVALASCTLAPDHCITMSDCDTSSTCVEGLCVPNAPPDTVLSTEGGVLDATTSTVDATPVTDAGQDADAADDASDASDDALTDAPTDG